jgi:hypothetical protein
MGRKELHSLSAASFSFGMSLSYSPVAKEAIISDIPYE